MVACGVFGNVKGIAQGHKLVGSKKVIVEAHASVQSGHRAGMLIFRYCFGPSTRTNGAAFSYLLRFGSKKGRFLNLKIRSVENMSTYVDLFFCGGGDWI
jgi:hypothetical protein